MLFFFKNRLIYNKNLIYPLFLNVNLLTRIFLAKKNTSSSFINIEFNIFFSWYESTYFVTKNSN